MADYIFVMDHADNVTIYDAAFTAVGSADSLYDAYASSDEGVVYLPTGEVVLPGYRYNSDLGFGLLCVADEDYNYGVVDLEGNIVVPFDEYEYFTEFDINGYARVEKDGLYGLIDLSGKCVVPCEYDEIERLAFAGDYVYGLGGYACVEKGGKFGYVSLETGEATCPINYVDPTIVGLSMVAPDITGALYIIAADGTTTPTDYAEIYEYTDGDGSLLLAQNAEGLWGLVDWHGNVLLDFTFDSSYYITISADGAALLVEGEDGMTGYTISGTPATTTAAPAAGGRGLTDRRNFGTARALSRVRARLILEGSRCERPCARFWRWRCALARPRRRSPSRPRGRSATTPFSWTAPPASSTPTRTTARGCSTSPATPSSPANTRPSAATARRGISWRKGRRASTCAARWTRRATWSSPFSTATYAFSPSAGRWA